MKFHKIILLSILLIAFFARFIGVKPGFNLYHPDEGKAGYISSKEMYLSKSFNPLDYNYPTLVPLTEFAVFRSIIYPNIDNIENYPDAKLLYLGRYITAFFGLLTVVIVYLIAINLFKKKTIALISALIIALNLRSIANSQLDLPDTYNAFYLVLAMFFTARARSKPTFWRYFLCGVAIGLSFSTKLQIIATFPFAVMHIEYAFKQGKNLKNKFINLFSKKVFLAILSAVIIFLIVNAYEIINIDLVIPMMKYQSYKYAFGINKLSIYYLYYFYKIVLTTPISLAIALSVIFAIKNKETSILIPFSALIFFIYYFLYLTGGAYYARNFTTIIPVASLIAAYGIDNLLNLIKPPKLISFLIIFVFLFSSAKNVVIHDYAYIQPWSLVLMRNFTSQNTPPNSTIASHPWDKYTIFSLPSTDQNKNLNFVDLNLSSNYSLQELKSSGADYALFGLDLLSDSTSSWWQREGKFAHKPDEISLNTFAALSISELTNYTLFSSIKPWQAPDNNYVFVKIPDFNNISFKKQINSYNFNYLDKGDLEGWKTIYGSTHFEGWLKADITTGHYLPGSLEILPGKTSMPVTRWVSPPFRVKPNSYYKVTAYVKAGSLVTEDNKNAFIRIDFYNILPEVWNEGTLGDSNSISERYYGNSWKKLEIITPALENANYATVSFQTQNANTQYWIDDISILESEEKYIPDPNVYKYKIPINILVPLTNGNL